MCSGKELETGLDNDIPFYYVIIFDMQGGRDTSRSYGWLMTLLLNRKGTNLMKRKVHIKFIWILTIFNKLTTHVHPSPIEGGLFLLRRLYNFLVACTMTDMTGFGNSIKTSKLVLQCSLLSTRYINPYLGPKTEEGGLTKSKYK